MAGFVVPKFNAAGIAAESFIGGAAKGANEQMLAEEDAKDQDRKARAAQQIKLWQQEQKQRDKEQSANEYLTSIGVTPEGRQRAILALRWGMSPKDIVSGLETAASKSNNQATPSQVISGGANAQGADTSVLDSIKPEEGMLAAPIVRAVEMDPKYGYQGGYGGIDLSKYPDKPGYYGFPDWPGVGNTHAAGGYGWEPDIYKHYAEIVSKEIGRDVNFRNPSDQDLVFDKAWSMDGKSNWAPYWNGAAWGRAAKAASASGVYTPPQAQMTQPQQSPQMPQPMPPQQAQQPGFACGGQVDPAQANQAAMMAEQQPQGQDQQITPRPQSPLPPQVSQAQPQQPDQNQAQGQMSDANNDVRNPAIQQQMPGQQMAQAAPQGSLCFHLPGQQSDKAGLANAQIQHYQSEDAATQQLRQIEQQKLMDQRKQNAIANERARREQDWKMQQKPATPEDQLEQNILQNNTEKYLSDPKTGIDARWNTIPDLRKSAFDTNSMMDILNRGFQAKAPQEWADNMNRWTQGVLGINLKDLGIDVNPASDVTLLRKDLANSVIDRLKTLHFGRITNYEAQTVRDGFAAPINTPSTNIKITLAMQTILKEAQEGTKEEYNKAYNLDGQSDLNSKWGPGVPTIRSVAAARILSKQMQDKYDSDQAPWPQPKTQADVDAIPPNQWFELKKTGDMYIKDSSGYPHAAGEKVVQ